jgi:hypothetical protein
LREKSLKVLANKVFRFIQQTLVTWRGNIGKLLEFYQKKSNREDYLIFYLPLENGIEIPRVVSRYRDLDAMFDVD